MDQTPINHQALRAAKVNYRRLVFQLTEGKSSTNAMIPPAYKLGELLDEALGQAWKYAETRTPNTPGDI
jgi:hypothetical protein